jgi:hypothetical protein
VLVGIAVFTGVGVAVGTNLGIDSESRVFVGGTNLSVATIGRVGTSVAFGAGVGVDVSVGVGTYCVITSTVNAAMVLRFEKAESTILCGLIAATLGACGPFKAAAATMQKRLNPRTPAPKTVNGPRYSLTFTHTPWTLKGDSPLVV